MNLIVKKPGMHAKKRKKFTSAFLVAAIAMTGLVGTAPSQAVVVSNPAGVLNATTTMTINNSSSEFFLDYETPDLVTEGDEIVVSDGVARAVDPDDPYRYILWDGIWIPAMLEGSSWYPVGGYNLNDNGDCAMQLGTHTFATVTITVSRDAEYTFRFVDRTTESDEQNYLADPFLAVYEAPFNPNEPDTNVVGCNDDRGSQDESGDELSLIHI